MTMSLQALPALDDNYIWVLHDAHQALVIDPGESTAVFGLLERLGLTLAGILITHRHHDHVDGVAALVAAHPCPIYVPNIDPLPAALQGLALHTVHGGDCIELLGQTIHVLHTPGHLPEHVSYYIQGVPQLQLDDPWMMLLTDRQPSSTPHDEASPLLFCGDTLFSAGCGRVMDGRFESYVALYASLQRIAQLPPSTLVCCAHEYTHANLRFAVEADPSNAALQSHLDAVAKRRKLGRPSLPSTLALEQTINPFLRCHHLAVQQQVAQSGRAKRFQDRFSSTPMPALTPTLSADWPPLIPDTERPSQSLPLTLTTFIQLRQWKNQF